MVTLIDYPFIKRKGQESCHLAGPHIHEEIIFKVLKRDKEGLKLWASRGSKIVVRQVWRMNLSDYSSGIRKVFMFGVWV